jgi:hypothetical protein
MIRKFFYVAMVAGVALVFAWTSGQAQEVDKTEQKKEEIKQARMRKLTFAYELAAEGRFLQAPEYLITAAGVLRQLSAIPHLNTMKKIEEKPEITGAGKAEDDKELVPPTLLEQSEKWFKEASSIGAVPGSVKVDDLIKQAKERKIIVDTDTENRPVAGGPRQVNRVIHPGQTHTYNFIIFTQGYTHWAFTANRLLHVHIVHAGGPNNTWYDGVTSFAKASWFPLGSHPAYYLKHKTARITFRVENNLNAAAQYLMMLQ